MMGQHSKWDDPSPHRIFLNNLHAELSLKKVSLFERWYISFLPPWWRNVFHLHAKWMWSICWWQIGLQSHSCCSCIVYSGSFDEASFPLWMTSLLNHADGISIAVFHISMVYFFILVLCEWVMLVKRSWHVENTLSIAYWIWVRSWCLWMFGLIDMALTIKELLYVMPLIGACFFACGLACMMTRGNWLHGFNQMLWYQLWLKLADVNYVVLYQMYSCFYAISRE